MVYYFDHIEYHGVRIALEQHTDVTHCGAVTLLLRMCVAATSTGRSHVKSYDPILFKINANTPMQYTVIFHGCKNVNFQMKNYNIFLIFAQNINWWYTLVPRF